MTDLTQIDYHKALVALSDIYVSLHLFDLNTNTFVPIKSNEKIDKLIESAEGTTQEKLITTMRNIAADEYGDIIAEFSDLSTISERLMNKRSITVLFKGRSTGWHRARFITEEYNEDGTVSKIIYAVENINEEKKRESRLAYLASTDILTGIHNRAYGQAKIAENLEQQRGGLFCMFDIDRFKAINDTYGHQLGDEVLRQIGFAMKNTFRSEDVLMRLGGDEFVVFAVGVTQEEVARALIARFFAAISQVRVPGLPDEIMISLGATFTEENSTFDSLYKATDTAVYLSKHKKESSLTFSN